MKRTLLSFGSCACFKEDILYVTSNIPGGDALRIMFRDGQKAMNVSHEDEAEFWKSFDEGGTDPEPTHLRFGRCACAKEDILYVRPSGEKNNLQIAFRSVDTPMTIVQDDAAKFLEALRK